MADTDDNSAILDYQKTLDRMEPNISPVDPSIALTSIAISMRQITLVLNSINHKMEENGATARIQTSHIGQLQNAVGSLSSSMSSWASAVSMTLSKINDSLPR